MNKRIVIFDTTLRDGEQSPGASMNIEEKLEVAKQLARLNVDVMEAGFPISSPGDFEAVKAISQNIKGPSICGLARATSGDIDCAWDALKYAEKPRIHTFIATSDIHLKYKLKKTREQVLEYAVAAVKRAKSYCNDVEFSAEDASRTDIDYLCRVVEAVIDAGATTVNIPDTVGYAIPHEFAQIMHNLKTRVSNIDKAILSVHFHNDLGLAVAGSLSAVLVGAGQVECTINGIGERAGNAALEEIVMALDTRKDIYGITTGVNTKEIYRTSRMVSDITGLAVQANKAIVGRNAFAHEAGIHQHGVLEERSTYEIMDATSIGLTENKLVLGKHSGRHAFERRLSELGYELSGEELEKAFARFKEVADKKKEIFDEDLAALVADEVHSIPETYQLEYMTVITSLEGIPSATIKVKSGGRDIAECAMGVGSVDAVYQTIDKIVNVPHTLIDYNVKSVTGGTDAIGEVTIKIGDDDSVYIGRGASLDIVEASAKAYVQAINKLVYHQSKRKKTNGSDNN
ncbi:MAG TPA: 2-isopropylmalate synthase [Armatimonadetes bacterium]|nr:2-isopropylmalate synthase [Armatimonadota bacterium]